MELQRITQDLAREHIALFGISYDSVDTLAAFAASHGITYPLLSDEGSRVIRDLGMLDEDLERHHAEFGRTTRDEQRGVAYPAIFLLDEQGVVLQRRFHPNYRIRDTGTGLLDAVLGVASPDHGPEATVHDEVVRIRAYLDSPAYRPYQQLQLTVELAVKGGWHLYTAPIPPGYVPLSFEIAPRDGLKVGAGVWPAGRNFRVAGLDEEFSVLDGTVRISLPITFAAASGQGDGGGDLSLDLTVRYQACSETACLPPRTTHLVVSAREAALNRPS